jgi:hypothetical protein
MKIIMLNIKWFLVSSITFFLMSAMIYLFQDDIERFATRIITSLVMALVFRLMGLNEKE